MRRLSSIFMSALQSGFLAGLVHQVVDDPDLDLEIRDNYLNVYFKGNSLLKLAEVSPARYRVGVHDKFKEGLDVPAELVDDRTTAAFRALIPRIEQNIVRHGKRSLEVEYEQMIIRANNLEPRNNSEYFVVDRQYAAGTGRFDLVGVYWQRNRRQGQEVPLCLMEVKFALNRDISQVHAQLQRYYEALRPRAERVAAEFEAMFRQKIELGLYRQSPGRLAAMKTLSFSRDIAQFQFILILVDFNPNSSLLDLDHLRELPFARQVKVFSSGFAMWQQNVKGLFLP